MITYGAAIRACENGMQWQRPVCLLAELQSRKRHAHVITYGAAISACGDGMQWQRAARVLAEMQSGSSRM